MGKNRELEQLRSDWRKQIIKALFLVVGAVFFIEIIMRLVLVASNHDFQSPNIYAEFIGEEGWIYLVGYILIPTGLNLLAALVAWHLNSIENLSEKTKNYAIVVASVCICFVVSTIHSYFLVVNVSFILPVFISCMMEDKMVYRHTRIASAVLMVLSAFVAIIFDANWTLGQRLLNLLVSIILFWITSMMCLSVAKFSEREDDIISRSVIESEEMAMAVKIDAMTGLYNHAEFHHYMNENFGKPMVLAVIDIDLFKEINDSCGHKRGDEVLIRIAKVIWQMTQEYGPTFRYGGEEFTVALHEVDLAEAAKIMETTRMAVYHQLYDFLLGKHVTISVGLAEYRAEMENPSELFQAADEAMYRAKKNGRNCVELAE